MGSRSRLAGVVVAVLLAAPPGPAVAEEAPTRWEQLFFPFPIVGAPPQLEQQVQLFTSVFGGDRGGGVVPAAEVGWIATPHLGLVAQVPYQIGWGGQAHGVGDLQLLVQYLAAGSLRLDAMISVGAQLTVPTAQHGLGNGDLLVGLFVYAAQRYRRHLILELNLTAVTPTFGSGPIQLPINAMLSVLVTRVRFPVPIYLQCELDTTTYVRPTAETVFVAPEVFIGPVHGMRAAAGVSFNVAGDPVHRRTYSLTWSIDLPNRYGY